MALANTASITIAEMREFAGFSAAEQRYIRRSLDIGLARRDAFTLWGRSPHECMSIRGQYVAYQDLKSLRGALPDETSLEGIEAFCGKLTRLAAFDLAQGRIESFGAFRFLYERLLGATVRPWLPSAFCAASALPQIAPERRKLLLQSLSEAAATAVGWSTREPSFLPEFIEKRRPEDALVLMQSLTDKPVMTIDPTVYRNAVERLSEGLARYETDPADDEVRDEVIQRFEYTYDLAAKMLRRALAETEDSPGEVDRMTFATMIRTAWEKGLTHGSYPEWHDFRDDRNKTSHTYRESIAMEVMAKIPAFLAEARFVLDQLENAGPLTMPEVRMAQHELAIVREIVDRCLPAETAAFVFGSRATGHKLKPWSDLDLAFEGPEPLSLGLLGRLASEFDEALLDWKVDVIDLKAVSPEFRRIVDAHKVPLPAPLPA